MVVELIRPHRIEEALSAVAGAEPDTHLLAGGTDLVPDWQSGRIRVRRFVDLTALDLAGARPTGEGLVIGALTTFAEILRSPLVAEALPALKEAAAAIGAPQTRTLATLGGNLVSAVPSLDSGPALLVHDADVRLLGADGERLVPLADFFLGPRQTDLRPGEMLTEIRVPAEALGRSSAFLKFGRRRAMSLAVVNVAASLERGPAGEIRSARVALGAVAPTPLRARAAEALLTGERASAEVFAAAAEAAAAACRPIDDLRASAAYRRELVRVLVRRALDLAWRRSGGEAVGDG